MWNYIVLGQVPGTDYHLNFTSVLIVYALVLLAALRISARLRFRKREPAKKIDFVQLSLLDSTPRRRLSASHRLTSFYVSLATVAVMKFSQLRRSWLKKQLSLHFQDQ